MITVIARWRVQDGAIDTVLEALGRMAALVAEHEPGCILYQANRSNDDPNLIVLYERYADDDALAAHRAAAHFKEIVEGEIVPLLELREREFLVPVL